jgi:hypothetical protein
MKKIKIIAVFAALTAFSAPAFSIAQIGVQGNYTNLSFEQSGSANKYSGTGFGGFARFTVGIPLLITFGAGPYIDYATLTGGPSTSPESKNLRVGGELVVYADVIGNLIGVTPYGRFGYGYEGNTINTTVANVTYSGVYYGGSGHTLFGLTLKVLPLIYVFAEGGPQWSTLNVPGNLKDAGFTAADVTTTGWRASLGAMIWL